jgi:hypothetical protein
MKTLRSHLSVVAVIALTLVSFSVPRAAAAGRAFDPQTAQTKSTKISKKKLKVLLSTAKTAADHQEIAAYYRQEAQRLTSSSREHLEMAAIYEKKPPVPNPKGGPWLGAVAHCRRLAQLDAEEAKEADALAALHEEEAKNAAQGQQ